MDTDINIVGEIDRVKMKFNGTGPRIHGRPGRIWPRDEIIPENEYDKMIPLSLRRSIDEEKQQEIKEVLINLFTKLAKCNVNGLFQNICSLDKDFLARTPFEMPSMLERRTDYPQIIELVHSILLSVGNKHLNKLFGSNRNRDIFKRHLKWLVVGNAKLRKIEIDQIVSQVSQPMQLDKIPWLRGLGASYKNVIFKSLISFLMRFFYNLLRRFFYITHGNPYMHKLFYYRYDLWQKIQARQINHLINSGMIEMYPYDGAILLPRHEVSKIKFHLKKSGLRLICTKQKESFGTLKDSLEWRRVIRAVSDYVLKRTPNYKPFRLNDLLEGLKFFQKQMNEEGKKVYFVRADIKDCFPSIDQRRLHRILKETLSANFPDNAIYFRRQNFEKKPGRSSPPYDLVISENADTDEIHSLMSIEELDKLWLRAHILNPVLRESRTSKNFYNLKAGIRQGSKFSTILCAIYIQNAFNEYLGDLLSSNESRIYGYVDDILFISTNLHQSERFMRQMLDGFESYNLRINVDKLKCNFSFRADTDSQDKLCRLDDHLVFYKRKISLQTLQCTRHFDYNFIDFSYTFNATPYNSLKIMKSTIHTVTIEPINLDYQLNGLFVVIKNILEHSLNLAHRIGTLMIVSFELRSLESQDAKRLMKLIIAIVKHIMRAIVTARRKGFIENGLDRCEVRLIVISAFELAWSNKRLRHRTVELKKLREFYRNFRGSYSRSRSLETSYRDEDVSFSVKDEFIEMLDKLRREFTSSNFFKQVNLPAKA